VKRNPQARAALGRVIRLWREEKGISQEALAHQADFKRTYVGSIERGETNLGFEGLWQLLHALGRSWSELGHALDREGAFKARPVRLDTISSKRRRGRAR
jgi:transcriptional regulator with XRE-family HTH domain